eukprot:GFKZ01002636.1.p1 GENE.GFKZ01002636.1~~GFKZ01002636.1.p1  ORF type:complete len:690 (+),score=80.33 GFKZ01002636.1:234-2303(+)
MLLAVGGLMATLILPAQTVPTLALTATITTARLIARALHRPNPVPPDSPPTASPSSSQPPSDVNLIWQDVTCHLAASKSHPNGRVILDKASGHARPGRILAILGPSGSGKTTLLNALAGRLPYSSKVCLSGQVAVNGVSIDHVNHVPAYVTQEDLFFSQLTVQETLEMAANMRLPRDMPSAEKRAFVDTLVRRLGLVGVTETRVGDEKTRGISGGEKKRLSLGCELISAPRLVLCDEPTTGLDAFQAERVVKSLRELAEAGHTVVCSIHQPSGSIFDMIDDMVLLAGGRVVYEGPVVEAPSHFKEVGFPLPERCNPAERYLDLISIDYTSNETVSESEQRIDKLVSAFGRRARSVEALDTKHGGGGAVVRRGNGSNLGNLGQIRLLLQRAWRQITRDKKTAISRFMSSLMSGLLFGAIYWRIGLKQSSIQSRLGLLQVCTINTAMTVIVKTLNVFPREGVLVNRERARGSYSILQYFVSKLIAEMPVSAFYPLIFSVTVYPMVQLSGGIRKIMTFLGIITLESFTAAAYGLAIGALVPSTEAALAIGPSTFVLQIVFGGLFVTEDGVPGWATWIPRISLIKHAYEGLCVNELRGLEFDTEQPTDLKSGDQVLQRVSWGDSTVMKTVASQCRVLSFYYLFTYAVLTLKKPRFEKLQPAIVEEVHDKGADTEDVAAEPSESGQRESVTEES